MSGRDINTDCIPLKKMEIDKNVLPGTLGIVLLVLSGIFQLRSGSAFARCMPLLTLKNGC
jgi:hypothetical protein